MNNSKIMVVDDEVAILKLLEVVLRKEGFVNIKVVNDSRRAVEIANIYNPDIIILDIMMPSVSGFEVFREIKRFSDVSIIFLSAKCDELDRIIGLGLGADDYITKPFSPKEVAFRIKAHLRVVERIKKQMNKDIEQYIVEDGIIDFKKGLIIRGKNVYELRAKELKLLKILVMNKNNILSKDQIIKYVWGEYFEGYENTLMVHIRGVRKKLENNPSKPRYIKTVKGIGYRFNENEN